MEITIFIVIFLKYKILNVEIYQYFGSLPYTRGSHVIDHKPDTFQYLIDSHYIHYTIILDSSKFCKG
jgi:hypothetical protein